MMSFLCNNIPLLSPQFLFIPIKIGTLKLTIIINFYLFLIIVIIIVINFMVKPHFILGPLASP